METRILDEYIKLSKEMGIEINDLGVDLQCLNCYCCGWGLPGYTECVNCGSLMTLPTEQSDLNQKED